MLARRQMITALDAVKAAFTPASAVLAQRAFAKWVGSDHSRHIAGVSVNAFSIGQLGRGIDALT